MDNPLLTIGAFARAVGLTASALRHYDECGLLQPAEVDDDTGYRYYTPDLADRARLVAQMRAAGMPIEAMRVVLDSPLGAGRSALQEFLAEQEARSAHTTAVVTEVLAGLESVRRPAAPATVAVRGPELAAALRQVRPAADLDPASALSGILLDLVAGSLDVVATNRHWMADRTLPVENTAATGRVVVGRAAALALSARLDARASVWLEMDANQLAVDGEPQQVRPEPYPAHRILLAGLEPVRTRAVLARDELVAAIEATGGAEVVVLVHGSGVVVGTAPDDPGCPVGGTTTGPDVTLRLGSALALRAVAATLGPEVELGIAAPDRAVRIGSPYQPGFLALLMPYAVV